MGARRRRRRYPEPPPLVIDGEIAAFDRRLEKARAAVIEVEDKRHVRLVKLVNEKLAPEKPFEEDQIQEGVHRCEGSPSGQCVYDLEEDMSLDYCLFCHKPYERK